MLKKHPDMWSRKHAACVRCGEIERPHESRGLCSRCIKYIRPRSKKVRRRVDGKIVYPGKFGGLREKHIAAHPDCCICGKTQDVVVHHVDGIKEHNTLPNFVTLCRQHHSSLHKYVDLMVFWSDSPALVAGLMAKRVRKLMGIAA